MRLEASCAIAVILNFTNRLTARFHRNGSRIYALSLLLQRSVDQGDQSNQANQRCDYESEDRRPYRYINSQKQDGDSNHRVSRMQQTTERPAALRRLLFQYVTRYATGIPTVRSVPPMYTARRAVASAGANHQKRNWGIKTIAARTGIKE